MSERVKMRIEMKVQYKENCLVISVSHLQVQTQEVEEFSATQVSQQIAL